MEEHGTNKPTWPIFYEMGFNINVYFDGPPCLMRVEVPTARIVPSSFVTRALALMILPLASVISP